MLVGDVLHLVDVDQDHHVAPLHRRDPDLDQQRGKRGERLRTVCLAQAQPIALQGDLRYPRHEVGEPLLAAGRQPCGVGKREEGRGDHFQGIRLGGDAQLRGDPVTLLDGSRGDLAQQARLPEARFAEDGPPPFGQPGDLPWPHDVVPVPELVRAAGPDRGHHVGVRAERASGRRAHGDNFISLIAGAPRTTDAPPRPAARRRLSATAPDVAEAGSGSPPSPASSRVRTVQRFRPRGGHRGPVWVADPVRRILRSRGAAPGDPHRPAAPRRLSIRRPWSVPSVEPHPVPGTYRDPADRAMG